MFGVGLPTTEDEFYQWSALLMAIYLAIVCLTHWRLKGNFSAFELVPKVFNSVTFSTSIILLMGVFYPAVLTAIGTTKPFLLVAGFIGLGYGLMALRPK